MATPQHEHGDRGPSPETSFALGCLSFSYSTGSPDETRRLGHKQYYVDGSLSDNKLTRSYVNMVKTNEYKRQAMSRISGNQNHLSSLLALSRRQRL